MKSKIIGVYKIAFVLMAIAGLLYACKKDSHIDPRIAAHYLFKPGTYWVYSGGIKDSMYVAATGSRDGRPYMQINDVIKANGVTTTHTIYIGAGPKDNQMQIWGYDYNGNTTPQVIFQIDTPDIGTQIGQGCYLSGIGYMSGMIPSGISGPPLNYGIDYATSAKSQGAGNMHLYFYPDLGIVQMEKYNTQWGDLYLNLLRSHIVN